MKQIHYFPPIFGIALVLLFAWALGNTLLPLILAFLLTYLLYPLVLQLQKIKIPETWAIYLTFLATVILMTGSLALVAPKAIQLLLGFTHDFPRLIEQFLGTLNAVSRALGLTFEFKMDNILSEIKKTSHEISFSNLTNFSVFLKNSAHNLMGILAGSLTFLIFPFFFYFLLSRFVQIKKEFKSFIPPCFHNDLHEFSQIVNRALSGYILGQLVVCSILATFYALLFWVVGMPYWLVIGVASGFSFIVPYLGFGTALVVGMIVSLGQDPSLGHSAIVLGIYLVGQSMESFVLTPKISGEKVGLDPLITILALIIGANLCGFMGLLIAIPIVGILKEYYLRLKAYYHKTEFYKQKP